MLRENMLLHAKGFCYAYFVIWLFIGLGWISFGNEWNFEERLFLPVPIAVFTWLSVFLAIELVSGLMGIFGQVLIIAALFCVGGAGYAGLLATGHIVPPAWITINKELLQPIIVGVIYGIFPFALQPRRFRFTIPRDPGEGAPRT